MTSTTARSPEDWRELIRQHGASGQGIKAFCERHGVVVSAFYYWRRRLSAETPPAMATTALAVSFVSVETAPESVTPLELVLRCGRCVRVVAGFDGPTLLRLIDVVEGGA